MPVTPSQSSPPEAEAAYSILDLVPLEKLQQIQDAFARAGSIASTLTDPEGVAITVPSNHCRVCSLVRATQKGRANCISSGKQLGRLAREEQRAIHQRCYSIGFTDAAAPIIVGGRHIANWLIGQYQVGAVDEPRVRQYALEIGADPEEMLQAFQAMPKLTMEEFENKLSFLELMANEISTMGYQNLVQRQQTEELKRTKDQLEMYQVELELLVEQRTAALREANDQLTMELSQKARIQRRQNRLITAIENAAESIIITTPNGKIIYVNPAFTRLTGYTPQEVLGHTPRLLQSGYHDDQFYRHLWEVVASGQVWAGRFVNKKKDGTVYREESTISSVKDDQGRIVNYVAVKRDITKEVELENQLRQAQRLESIGTLAAGVAHEINSPIQYVLGNTQFLGEALCNLTTLLKAHEHFVKTVAAAGIFGEEVAAIGQLEEEVDLAFLKEEAGKAIDQALEGIQRISAIVKAMKDFAQPGSLDKVPENLNGLIETTITVSRSRWQNLADMELQLDPTLPAVPLLAGRIKQVLLDMLLNSIHALTEKYGDPPRQKGKITISTRTAGDCAELRLADTGCGIPAEIIHKIFDPFFTTKPVGRGRGQGLSVVHGIIVDNHGGSIRVVSTLGLGTEFIIELPLAPGC